MAELPVDTDRWEADVVLADGSTAHVRAIRPSDRDLLAAFHERQSPDSVYFRYFTPRPTLSASDLDRSTTVDGQDRMAFVALLGDDIVAVAQYDRWGARDDAEVAFMVDDRFHGLGLGTVLLEFLADAARRAGFRRFTAQVLPSNRKMLRVFRHAGFQTSSEFGDGVIDVVLDIEPTAEALAAMEERGHQAEARSVARLLAPESVAVIGAGRAPGGLGHQVVINLLAAGFAGPVVPVNLAADLVAGHLIAGLPAFPSIRDVPASIDQAVIAVPAPAVEATVLECARAGVKSLVVVSAGFREAGPAGEAAEHELVRVARRYGMRLVGPNCLGIINTDPAVRLHASHSPATPLAGPLGLLTQSGSLGTAILEQAEALGLGISTFVEAGNKADVSANDLLQYWEDDGRTRVVLLHLESFGNTRRFSRIVRRVARRKPVVAVKSGVSVPGWAGDPWLRDVSVDDLLGQMGVVRVSGIEDMFDVARVLQHQPVPAGPRVAVVANAGGPARLAIDACTGAGLVVAELAPATIAGLAEVAPTAALRHNPIDLTHEASPADYERTLAAVASDPGVDAVVAIYAPPLSDRSDEVIRAVTAGAAAGQTPVVATILGVGAVDLPAPGGGAVPSFTFPDRAARALGAAAAYGTWLAEPPGEIPAIAGVDEARGRALVDGVLAGHPEGSSLTPAECDELLGAYGVSVAPRRLVASAAEATRAARALGYPVTLKATGLPALGKTEAGGVALDLHRPEDVRRAHRRMSDALGPAMVPAVVQSMVRPGVDLAVGISQHPLVGGILALGPGGAAGAATGAAAVRALPVTDLAIERLLDEPAVRSWFAAVAGDVDRSAVADLLARLGQMADHLPELADLRANPVIVSGEAAVVADVSIRLAPWERVDPLDVRRL